MKVSGQAIDSFLRVLEVQSCVSRYSASHGVSEFLSTF